MKKVRGELEYLKNKTEAKQNDLMGGKKIVALEKEINWFKTEALRQSNQVKTQKEDIGRLWVGIWFIVCVLLVHIVYIYCVYIYIYIP